MDPVEKLKKKMIEKLRESGAPAPAVDAVDFLTPDDLLGLGITAATSILPGGFVASKAVKAAGKGSAKSIKMAKEIADASILTAPGAFAAVGAEYLNDFTRDPEYQKEISKLAQELGISESEAREIYKEAYPKESYAYSDYNKEAKRRIRQNTKLKYERPTE